MPPAARGKLFQKSFPLATPFKKFRWGDWSVSRGNQAKYLVVPGHWFEPFAQAAWPEEKRFFSDKITWPGPGFEGHASERLPLPVGRITRAADGPCDRRNSHFLDGTTWLGPDIEKALRSLCHCRRAALRTRRRILQICAARVRTPSRRPTNKLATTNF